MIRSLVNALIASMIFFPVRPFSARPLDFGLQAEDAWCRTEDGVLLHGWFIQAQAERPCLLLFHGNADNISIRLPKAKEWASRGLSVLLIDYRGYGKSGGRISSGEDLYRDARAGLKWLREKKKLTSAQIVLYGESIGSVPAIRLGTEEPFKAVILEAPFTSLREMAKIHYGFVPDFFLKDFIMDNESRISQLKSPVFILHGTADEIVPIQMGKRLFAQAPEPKRMFEIQGAHHNDISEVGGQSFFDEPFRFLAGERTPSF